ncbi:Imm50 family immunity protein [Paenibacillus ihumii]|uniref:Imm50 family immunity protein n=1 Tax=Paenibacillus ihumii TaxID=687436 RepID=UPI0006D79A90|nr:Imm50 family immunity protein [Paenibacillus ihumii]
MWYKVLERNNFLVSLYEQVPELKDVRIAEVNIHDEGRVVAVKFDMPYYAERPPKKWVELGENTVAVRIDLSAIQEITLNSGSFDFKANIEIFKDEANLIVVKITGTVNALIKAESGFIQSVTGYCN